MTDTGNLRTQHFAQAIAALPDDQLGVIKSRCSVIATKASSSPWLLGVFTALAALMLLLVLRPPFVLKIEEDASRPWRSKSAFSWISAVTCALLLALVAIGVPFLCKW